jgi:hypothetical protein
MRLKCGPYMRNPSTGHRLWRALFQTGEKMPGWQSMTVICTHNEAQKGLPPIATTVSLCGTFAIIMRQNARIVPSTRYAPQMRPLYAAAPLTAVSKAVQATSVMLVPSLVTTSLKLCSLLILHVL